MLGAVFSRAEFLGDEETALAVQLLLVGREKHALPYRTLRPVPGSPLKNPRVGLQPLLMNHWDSMGSDGPQWDELTPFNLICGSPRVARAVKSEHTRNK
ncbi:hypothetical protein D9M68_968340 [compost metagenome]